MHGRQTDTTWTMLAATAAPGDATITVQDNVSDWRVGQTLVMVTSFYRDSMQDQNEVRTIRAVVDNAITLDKPLSFQHWGYDIADSSIHMLQACHNVMVGDKESAVHFFCAGVESIRQKLGF